MGMRRMGIVNARWIAAAALVLSIVAVPSFVGIATDAELYFASDKNGENRVTKVREGDSIWIVVYDPDEDIDCDVRDKIWTDIKVMDVKTGAHIVWKSYLTAAGDAEGDPFGDPNYQPYKGHSPGPTAGFLGEDYLEEVDHATGLFVSQRPFQIGTRLAFSKVGRDYAHVVGPYTWVGPQVEPTDFQWGGYLYADDVNDADDIGDDRVWVNARQEFIWALDPGIPNSETPPGRAYLPPGDGAALADDYMLGRFENMDTLVGLYVDQNDPSDVGLTLGKITDTEATISWGREVYPDANEAATIIVDDPDENLSCNDVEIVPVFVLVNPGSWNPPAADPTSANDFCMLKRYGGVVSTVGDYGNAANAVAHDQAIEWYNIYACYDPDGNPNERINWLDLAADDSNQPNETGTYYVDYPVQADNNVISFDTASATGVTRVMFYATETGADTGIFEVRFNSILRDLGFNGLNVRDVLVAYYVDPNDQDDFKLATAYIEEKKHSTLQFTDFARKLEDIYWIGRDPVYIQIIDANANTDPCCPEKVVVHVCDPHEVDDSEWLILDELSSNSSIFFTHVGMPLISVWDALGLGDPGTNGGYSLQLDNWELEAFNEDSIYARYNDAIYLEGDLMALADADIGTPGAAFPPRIDRHRSANDVSFSIFEVGDTQVFDGDQTTMYFLDRQGNRVDQYLNSDCVFVEVIDPDQDEDRLRRERIDGMWDGTAGAGQNVPFGPIDFAANHPANGCGFLDVDVHLVNDLLGDTNIFRTGTWAKTYVLNPRNGRWATLDLLETGVDTGDFVSVTCLDLVDRYDCVPALDVLPGDTILAAYQDPSNHSDVAWISIEVSIGGARSTGSTVAFVDVEGNEVAAYLVGDPIYVRVVDPSLAGAGSIPEALVIDEVAYDLAAYPAGGPGAFLAGPIDLLCTVGETLTATYVDPADPTDTSSATVQIVASELRVDRFYAGPNPFDDTVTFSFAGQGLAETFTVSVYDLTGRHLWTGIEENVLGVMWDGRNERGDLIANGACVYVVMATGSGKTFDGKGTLFIHR